MHHHSHHWLVVRELPANFSLLKMTTACLWERLTEEELTVATTLRNIGCKENDEMKVALPRAASVLIGLDGWMCDTDTYLASKRSLKTLCSVQVFVYFFTTNLPLERQLEFGLCQYQINHLVITKCKPLLQLHILAVA